MTDFRKVPNSYFLGADLVATRDSEDGRQSVRLNIKEGLCAVEVRDDETYHGDTRELIETIGEEHAQSLYERQQEDYFRWADEQAKEAGFGGVFQAGRSGGWAAVEDTRYIDLEAARPMGPLDDDDAAMFEARDRFVALAFELDAAIADYRERWIESMREESYAVEARQRGRNAAEAAATWTVDGNTKRDHALRVLGMIRAGDPEADDYLPNRPNLSGEFSDAPTVQSLTAEIIGAETEPYGDEIEPYMDVVADAFEDGVGEAFEPACERELIRFVGEETTA